MEAHERILDRDLALAESAELRAVVKRAVVEVVNHATWVLVRCHTEVRGDLDANRAALTIYRHGIEQADAIGGLCEIAASEAAIPNLRSLFEAWLYLQYLFEDPGKYRARSLAWLVSHEMRRLAVLRRFDPENESYAEQVEDLRDGWGMDKVRVPDALRVREAIRASEARLASPDLGPVRDEYERLAKQRGHGPNWHALFGGPSTARKLAKHLKFRAAYDGLYAHWADVSHTSDADRLFMKTPAGLAVRRLRLNEELAQRGCGAAQYLVRCSTLMLEGLRPGETGFAKWYAEDVRPLLEHIGCFRRPA